MTPFVSLRPTTPADREFLYLVYAGTRQEELALTDWDDARKSAFLRMQFEAQTVYYVENYPGADFLVILAGGEPAGRLYLHRRPGEIRVVDISLLPEFRNRGIGTALLRDLFAEASGRRASVTIHVEHFNPALQLYGRLGFKPVEERGVYYFMKWTPEETDGPDPAG